MKLGETFEFKFSFSQDDVNTFSIVTGDDNPIHLDEEHASKTIFKRRILHGFLSGSVFSRVFGTMWPGNGTIYLKQEMNFLQPMYAGEEYMAKFEVLDALPKNVFSVKTDISNAKNQNTIEGQALIKYDIE